MTQEEKIEMLKETIVQLYEKEGRSQVYISDLLKVNRKELGIKIREWELIKSDEKHFTPSNQKFLNKNKKIILEMLDSDCSITEIANKVGKTNDALLRTFIHNDRELLHHYNQYNSRLKKRHVEKLQKSKDESRFTYDFEVIVGEIWKNILGFESYQVSNMGRVRKYVKKYNDYQLIMPFINSGAGYLYISLRKGNLRKSLSLARLVAHAFVSGYSEINNTIDHKDGDKMNNKAENLEWVSQAENNARSYKNGKVAATCYSRLGKYKEIILDEKYHFKTAVAFAKFLNVSNTQARRYLNGETKIDRKIEIIY